jgi:hypothetical protein
MKNNTIKLLTLAVSLVLAIGSAQAATMNYTLYADQTVTLPTAGNALNQNGRVWLGNFGSDASGTLLSLASIQAGVPNLLNSFRPLTSFEISGGALAGDTGNGLRGSYSVGASSVSAGNFAGQNAYILALSSTSSVWTDALASWQSNGASNAILIRSGNNFTLASNDPTVDFEVYAGPGATLVFGSQTASSITATSVPEPSVTALLLFGAAGLGALRLRRQTV